MDRWRLAWAGRVVVERRSYQAAAAAFPSIARVAERVQLSGRAARTVESCVAAVRLLALWAEQHPAGLDEERVRRYFLHLLNDEGYARQGRRAGLAGPPGRTALPG